MTTYVEALMRAENLRCEWCYLDHDMWIPARNHSCSDCYKQWNILSLREAIGEQRYLNLIRVWISHRPWASDASLDFFLALNSLDIGVEEYNKGAEAHHCEDDTKFSIETGTGLPNQSFRS